MVERHGTVLALVGTLPRMHPFMSLHVPVEVEHLGTEAARELLFQLALHVDALDVHAQVALASERASTLRALEREARVRIPDVFGNVENFNRANFAEDLLSLPRQLMERPHVRREGVDILGYVPAKVAQKGYLVGRMHRLVMAHLRLM